MAKVPYGVEPLPKISIAWVVCTNLIDDGRQTDGRTMTYSEREREFTFVYTSGRQYETALPSRLPFSVGNYSPTDNI